MNLKHWPFYLPSGVPPWGPEGFSRECVLRIPMRVVKGDQNGAP